jgi:hypothetical protein
MRQRSPSCHTRQEGGGKRYRSAPTRFSHAYRRRRSVFTSTVTSQVASNPKALGKAKRKVAFRPVLFLQL